MSEFRREHAMGIIFPKKRLKMLAITNISHIKELLNSPNKPSLTAGAYCLTIDNRRGKLTHRQLTRNR